MLAAFNMGLKLVWMHQGLLTLCLFLLFTNAVSSKSRDAFDLRKNLITSYLDSLDRSEVAIKQLILLEDTITAHFSNFKTLLVHSSFSHTLQNRGEFLCLNFDFTLTSDSTAAAQVYLSSSKRIRRLFRKPRYVVRTKSNFDSRLLSQEIQLKIDPQKMKWVVQD